MSTLYFSSENNPKHPANLVKVSLWSLESSLQSRIEEILVLYLFVVIFILLLLFLHQRGHRISHFLQSEKIAFSQPSQCFVERRT